MGKKLVFPPLPSLLKRGNSAPDRAWLQFFSFLMVVVGGGKVATNIN